MNTHVRPELERARRPARSLRRAEWLTSMVMKRDHLRIPVSSLTRSRAWYVETLGLTVEFEVPDRQMVALQDGGDYTIFLQEVAAPVDPNGTALWFQVDDVEASFAEWSARGAQFAHAPSKRYWGYGAELRDPDGYRVRLWDQRSMREK